MVILLSRQLPKETTGGGTDDVSSSVDTGFGEVVEDVDGRFVVSLLDRGRS